MATYQVLGYSLNFSEDYYEYGRNFSFFRKESSAAINSYDVIYNDFGNIENLVRNGENKLANLVVNVFNAFKKVALQRGVYDFSEDILIKNHEYKTIIEPISDAIKDIKYQLDLINSEEQETKQERRLSKANRPRMVGGGFGLGGAIKGMAMAGAINMGTGLIYGSINSVGNLFTSLSASSDRKALYKEAKNYLKEAFIDSLYLLWPFLRRVLK